MRRSDDGDQENDGAKYRDASGAFHLEEGLLEKYADSGRINTLDINAMIQQTLRPFGIHFQKERMAFWLLHSSF